MKRDLGNKLKKAGFKEMKFKCLLCLMLLVILFQMHTVTFAENFALSFDGINDYLQINSASDDVGASITIEFTV